MEKVKCPNPKCGRRILDNEETETEWTILEIKCQHCGKKVRLYCGPDGIEASLYVAAIADTSIMLAVAST